MGNLCGCCHGQNPMSSWNTFNAVEKRNISIYIGGIMLYKFALECFNASIVLLAADRFKAIGAFTAIGILSGLNQAFQCVGSIAIAPLIRRWPTRTVLSASIVLFGLLSAIIMIVDKSTGGAFPADGKNIYGSWPPEILFPIYSIIGITYGMVELIRRVIPRDIVGGDVVKLKRMDALVHILYETTGTAGAFLSSYLIVTYGTTYAPMICPPFFFLAGLMWRCISILTYERTEEEDDPEERQAFIICLFRGLLSLGRAFKAFGVGIVRGAQIVFSHRKFIWLIPAYSIPLFTHRYLENQLAPAFAKYVLKEGAYAQIMVGGSNFGELCGALFVFIFATRIKTPIPWLRLDAVMLLVIWALAFIYVEPANGLKTAWLLTILFAPMSFGWAAGDVSLSAYIQSALNKMQAQDKTVSPLGAVMAFLYVLYIILYAVLGASLGVVIDKAVGPDKKGDVHPALMKVGGAMYTVVAVIVMAGTFIPKGSLAFNPDLIDDDDDANPAPAPRSSPIKIISDGKVEAGKTDVQQRKNSTRDRELFENIVG